MNFKTLVTLSLLVSMPVMAKQTNEEIRQETREILEKCKVENVNSELDFIMESVEMDTHDAPTFKSEMEKNCNSMGAQIAAMTKRVKDLSPKKVDPIEPAKKVTPIAPALDPEKEKIARAGLTEGIRACKSFSTIADIIAPKLEAEKAFWKKAVEGPYDWNIFKKEMSKHCDISTAMTKAYIDPAKADVKYTVMCKSNKKEYFIPAYIDLNDNVMAEGQLDNVFVTLEFHKTDVTKGRSLSVSLPEGAKMTKSLTPNHNDIGMSSGFITKKMFDYTTDFDVTCSPTSLKATTKKLAIDDSERKNTKEKAVDGVTAESTKVMAK